LEALSLPDSVLGDKERQPESVPRLRFLSGLSFLLAGRSPRWAGGGLPSEADEESEELEEEENEEGESLISVLVVLFRDDGPRQGCKTQTAPDRY